MGNNINPNDNYEHLEFSKLELSAVKIELDKFEDIEKEKFLPKDLLITVPAEISEISFNEIAEEIKSRGYTIGEEEKPEYWRRYSVGFVRYKGIKYVGVQNA